VRLWECLLVAATAAVVAGFLLPAVTFPNVLRLPLEYSLADGAAGGTVDVQVHDTYVILGGGTLAWATRVLAAALVAALSFLLARRCVPALLSTVGATACSLWLLVALSPGPTAARPRPESVGVASLFTMDGYRVDRGAESDLRFAFLGGARAGSAVGTERGTAAWALLGTGLVLLAAAGALTRRDASRP